MNTIYIMLNNNSVESNSIGNMLNNIHIWTYFHMKFQSFACFDFGGAVTIYEKSKFIFNVCVCVFGQK